MEQEQIQKIVNTYEILNKLKSLPRQGWKEWKVPEENIESVASHIYGAQMLAFCIVEEAKLDLDILKVVAMLSLHETEELVIGDLTPFDHVTQEEKKKIGKEGVDKVLSNLSKPTKMQELIAEFEKEETIEAKFAKLCDKLECDLQAYLYQKQGLFDWNRVPEAIKQDDRIQKIVSQGADTIDQVFLEHDMQYYQENAIFQEIAEFLRTCEKNQ